MCYNVNRYNLRYLFIFVIISLLFVLNIFQMFYEDIMNIVINFMVFFIGFIQLASYFDDCLEEVFNLAIFLMMSF
jgi:hypothetical protein